MSGACVPTLLERWRSVVDVTSWCAGLTPPLQSVLRQLELVQFGPGQRDTSLTRWQSAVDHIDHINANRRGASGVATMVVATTGDSG
jgi:hypothetical protein